MQNMMLNGVKYSEAEQNILARHPTFYTETLNIIFCYYYYTEVCRNLLHYKSTTCLNQLNYAQHPKFLTKPNIKPNLI